MAQTKKVFVPFMDELDQPALVHVGEVAFGCSSVDVERSLEVGAAQNVAMLGEASDHIATNRPHTTGACTHAAWGVDRLGQVLAGQSVWELARAGRPLHR